jgi:hypothetical protein
MYIHTMNGLLYFIMGCITGCFIECVFCSARRISKIKLNNQILSAISSKLDIVLEKIGAVGSDDKDAIKKATEELNAGSTELQKTVDENKL